MKFYEIAGYCDKAASIIGLSCSGYLLFFSGHDRGIIGTILLVGWTIFNAVDVIKLLGELLIERIINRSTVGSIKKRLIEKIHKITNHRLVVTVYSIIIFGMAVIKIGVPFIIDRLG